MNKDYEIRFEAGTIEIPLRTRVASQEGIKVFRDDEFVLFLHESLDEEATSWVVAHASGFTCGFPDAEDEEAARGLAVAALADDLIRESICKSKEGMIANWLETGAGDRLAVLYALGAAIEAERVFTQEASFEAPTLERFIERIREDPKGVEVELHPDDDDLFLEWVEELDESEKQDIMGALVEAYADGGWGDGPQTAIYGIYPGVAEPGYDDQPFAIGNWWIRVGAEKKLRESQVVRILEACGAEVGFSDEWASCGECQRVVRTQGDSYGWTASFWFDEGDVQCVECAEEDPSGYLEYLKGNDRAANTMGIDLSDHGYMPVWGEFASGLYGGQMDSPEAIARAFERRGWDDFIFEISDVGQFDLHFTVWVKVGLDEWEVEYGDDEAAEWPFVVEIQDPAYSWRTMLLEDEGGAERVFATAEEAQEAGGARGTVYVWPNFDPGEEKAGEDPAEAMKRGLQAASAQMSGLRSGADATGGVLYVQVNADGTAASRVVSQEEFIEGIKS